MKIEGSAEELVFFWEEIILSNKKMAISNEMPPHEFPLLNRQEYQRIYKEAPQEVPKNENTISSVVDEIPRHTCNNKLVN